MKTRLFSLLLCLPALLAGGLVDAGDDTSQLKAEAIGIVKQFGGALKPELKQAIKSGGLAHAISVCSEKAPAISQRLSNETGWYIKRVSLKPRNAKTATPDDWETKVLQEFDRRQADGESAEKMLFAETVDGRYRLMKAQGVENVCMNCHGARLDPDTEAALDEKYPEDKARGYDLGQIRGAFSLAKDL